ncbi:hypothetical protein ASD45_18635 [Pseudolabrys sp. Root1462]|uniref:methyl-accepting chemotaxis protein n=1 Tax=Pseudolabrys sp. Root1462 TaxID=1736466 RepID=UPI000702F896|nr:methyl-accepting chemotaxis protein [Pseudolabrys sp. Root1462]KQY98004.1 hypothetical protein ASD45_18635 [Pseudolabrys sp. Root1462]
MPKFSDLRIITKVACCFLLLGAVIGGAIWFAAGRMEHSSEVYSKIIANDVEAVIRTQRAMRGVSDQARLMWLMISEDDLIELKKIAKEAQDVRQRMLADLADARKLAPAYEKEFDHVDSLAKSVFNDYPIVEKAALENNSEEAARYGKRLISRQSEMRKSLAEVNNGLDKTMKEKSAAAAAEVTQTVRMTGLAVALTLAAVLALAFAIVQIGIARPIAGLVAQMRKLAAGDFNIELPWLGRKDEVGEIAAAVDVVADKVGATIGNIKLAAADVTSASAEISTSTTDLSQRTEEQAASLEQTSASMEEIASTVKKNAENARQANAFVSETDTVAARGGEVVGNAVDAMARIEESSGKISDIIGVIDEIARQTNLLALNAAVEAARAGEAGRGFAVVAAEVRSLAQRSSQAAKDIKGLITNSNAQVKDGVDLVNKAGAALGEIVSSIRKVTDIVAQIAHASEEQAAGIEQVNRALAQMDEVTQQNSALVEENAATAKTLEHQAKAMDERVAAFRLRGSETAEGRQAPVARTIAPAKARAAAPAQKPVRQLKQTSASGGGPVRRMQADLADAVNADDWKEF